MTDERKPDHESESQRTQRMRREFGEKLQEKLLAAMEEDFFWAPVAKIHLFPWETSDGPQRLEVSHSRKAPLAGR